MSCATVLPPEITAGLDFQATVELPDYPATDWTGKLLLRGPQSIDLDATADGTTHVFTADAATTATWKPGDYWYSLRVSQGAAIKEADKGTLTILPDLANMPEGYDGRTQNQIALDALDAVIARRATQDQQRYTINGRELWRTPMADLLKLRAYYATQVSREKAKAKGCSRWGRPVIVKFQQQ